MAWYRTLGPVTYTDGGQVRHITQAGIRIDLTPAQAAELDGMIVLDRTTPLTYPRADFLKYESSVLFPVEGIEDAVYLANDSGLLYRWINDDYAAVGVSTTWDNVSGKPSVIAEGSTQADAQAVLGGTTTGRAVFTADDALEGRAALGAPPKDSVVYASDEGIVASVGTDVSAGFGALLNSAPAGATIQLQGGTYNVSTLRGLVYNNDVTVRGVPGKTKLVGDGSITVANYAADVMVRVDGGSIRFEHIAFENTGTVVGMKGLMELDDIEFDNCTFTGCTGVAVEVYDPAGVATRLGEGKQISWRNFRMTNCKVYDCEMGVVLRTDGGYDSVIVANTVFNNVGWAGVWVGTEYGLAVDRTLFQRLQSCVTVHDNVFRNMRLSDYAAGLYYVTVQVNAVVALGQTVVIHDNLIENVNNSAVWDDCEAIYTKARYFDIHDNILIDAGGFEAAIMVKGVAYDKSTTLASSMNGLTLPRATIDVASTEGFGHPTPFTALAVETAAGLQIVTFTGKTATSFTGCSGGTGAMATGGDVRGAISASGSMTGVSQPGKIHHNTVVFTRDDVAQSGITSTMPGVEIHDNLIDGATGRAITVAAWADHCIVKNNRVINHHGDDCVLIAADAVVEGNIIEEMDGSYTPAATSLRAFRLTAEYISLTGIILRNNVMFNRLEADGTRSPASEKLRFVHIQAVNPLSIGDIRILGNKARNISIGINVTVDGPISDLLALDNDWQNEDGTSITQAVSHASPRMIRDGGVLRGSSGSERALAITPVVSQSGTAGYTGILLDITESAVGSGAKSFIDVRKGGTSYWSVDSTGRMYLPAGPIEFGTLNDTTVGRASAGRLSVEGNLVAHVLSATAALNFGSVTAQSFADLTIAVTGAATGDCVSLGVPTEAVTAGIVYSAWVSATNTVTVRAHNYTAGALDPTSGTFKAAILR